MKPGRSFCPLLVNETLGECWRGVQFGEYGNVRMIRSRTHKLVHRYPNGSSELFDLVVEPGETTNVIDEPAYIRTREDLIRRLEVYFARYEDPNKNGLLADALPRQNADSPWYGSVKSE
jgi:choline-sulfatase